MALDPSLTDPVTGLANRRALLAELRRRVPSGEGAIVLLDLDFFRATCDPLEKKQVSRLLKEIADRLLAEAGPDALLYRYAGDSFCLLLPDVDRDRAVAAAESLRAAVSKQPFATVTRSGKPISLTATACAAAYPQDGRSPMILIEAAELALIAGKHMGRNRTAVAGRLDPAVLAEIGIFRGLPCPVFVGRVGEQAKLRQAALNVRHVGSSFALVRGTAGIGKSRLLQELCRWARSEHFVVLTATCHEERSTLPYGALSQCLESLFALDRPLAIDLLGRLSPEAQAGLAVVLRDLPQTGPLPAIDREQAGKVIFEAFGAVLDELARTGPILLALDETEAADAETLEVLRVARGRKVPFLFVGATNQERSEFDRTPAGEVLREPGSATLDVPIETLSPEEVDRLVHAILPDADVAPQTTERLAAQSGGNPLYVEETVRSLLLKGRIRLTRGKWLVPVVELAELPKDLDAAIQAVAAALPTRANALVTHAAVIGSEIDPELLQEILGRDEMEIIDLIDEARRARILVSSDSVAGADALLFPAAHSRRIRLTAAPASERREIHGRVGVAQEARHGGDVAHLADELAFHYGRAGNMERARHFDAIARKRAEILKPPDVRGVRRARIEPFKEALPAASLDHVTAMMRHFLGALKVGRLYPESSQVSASFLGQLRTELEAVLAAGPGVTISNTPTGPAVNGAATGAPAAAEFVATLDERLIESVTILKTFDPATIETVLRAFIEPMQRGHVDPDFWDRFLTRESLQAIDIVQKAYQARDLERRLSPAKAEQPVPMDELPNVRDTLRAVKASIENLRLYPPGHSLVEETAEAASRALTSLLKRLPALTLGTSDGELVLNGQAADRKFFGDVGAFVVKEIDRRELKSVTLSKGLAEEEVRGLVSLLAVAPQDVGSIQQRAQQFTHVAIGSKQYERATEGEEEVRLTPPPKPIRSEIRARELLAKPYEQFLTKEFQQQFPALIEVLSYGAGRPVAETLVERLGSHFHDKQLDHRQSAYRLLGRSLIFGSPGARKIQVIHSAASLRRRLAEDFDPANFKAAADLLPLWVPAATTVGCLGEVADIVGPILRRRAETVETPQEVARACEKAVQMIPATPAYPLLVAAAAKPKTEERRQAVRIMLAVGGDAAAQIVDLFVNESNSATRAELADELARAPVPITDPLIKTLGPEAPAERFYRALESIQPLLNPALLTHFGDLAETGPGPARLAILEAAKSWPPASSAAVVRRLVLSLNDSLRNQGIERAAQLRLDHLSAEIGRVFEEAKEEELLKICSKYFAAVPNPSVVPLLVRIAERRPRLFGLVKGYSDETRAAAFQALLQHPNKQATDALEKAADDPVLRGLTAKEALPKEAAAKESRAPEPAPVETRTEGAPSPRKPF